jgi:hypothetical protein
MVAWINRSAEIRLDLDSWQTRASGSSTYASFINFTNTRQTPLSIPFPLFNPSILKPLHSFPNLRKMTSLLNPGASEMPSYSFRETPENEASNIKQHSFYP